MHTYFLKITALIIMLIFTLSIVLKSLGFGLDILLPEPPRPSEPTEEVTTQLTEPSTSESVTENSTASDSTSSTTQSATEKPEDTTTAPSPTQPATEKPEDTTTAPSTTQPATEKPEDTTTAPSTTQPATEKPEDTTTAPSTTQPATEKTEDTTTAPSTTQPTTEKPEDTTTAPSTTQPATEKPEDTTTAPSTTQPATEKPEDTTTEPSTTQPTTEKPEDTTTEPTTTQPTTEKPEIPTTPPSTTEPTTKVEIGPQIRTVNQNFFGSFGGTGNDIFNDVDNTSDGGFVACGQSTSTDQDFQGVANTSSSNYSFVAKFDKSGKAVWKVALSSADRAYVLEGITVLSDGSIVAAGYLGSSASNPVEETVAALLLKYSSSGKLLWEKRFDGTKADIFTSVCATKTGFAVGGKSESTDGDFSFIKFLGKESPFVISFDSEANMLWETSLPGNNGGSLESIAADQNGNIFTSIITTSTTGSYAAFEGIGKGYTDTVVLKYDSNGNYLWNYVIASSARDEFGAITADESGGCVVAGYYTPVSTYTPNGTLAGVHNCGETDALTIRIDSNGKRKWINTIAGFGNDYINDITTVADGGYAVVGYTTSSDRDFAGITNGGENDSFVGFITPGGNTVEVSSQAGTKSDIMNCVTYSPLSGVIALGKTNSKDGSFNGMNSHLSDIYIMVFGFLPVTGFIVKYKVSISKY